jgi:hypothetical protein
LRIERDHDPLAVLVRYLSSRHLLLVIDNCEHLIAACAGLANDILDHCSDVRILATSREPVGIQAEVLWRLGPLDETASVDLFVARAREQRTEFVLEDSSTIQRVCRTLDHLPLAIELAAARSGVLAPAEILNGLRTASRCSGRRPRRHTSTADTPRDGRLELSAAGAGRAGLIPTAGRVRGSVRRVGRECHGWNGCTGRAGASGGQVIGGRGCRRAQHALSAARHPAELRRGATA